MVFLVGQLRSEDDCTEELTHVGVQPLEGVVEEVDARGRAPNQSSDLLTWHSCNRGSLSDVGHCMGESTLQDIP